MKVKKGDKISVEYTGKFEDGEVFDSSNHGDHSHPLDFSVGEGHVIPGFDSAVLNMEVGETKEITILPEEGYGLRDERLMQKVPRNALPSGPPLEVGMMLAMSTPEGQKIPVRISDVDEESVTLDLNHPLAGKKLIFDIKIVNIN